MLEITAVDVGQGSCIVAQKDGKACMIDCGSESDGAATNAIAFLRENGDLSTHCRTFRRL